MADGGWIGIPGPLARRRAARGMASRLRAARALPVPVLPDAGFDAGPAIHGALLDRVADLSVDLLAMGSLARRSYERSRPGLILATQDVEPLDRLLVTEARRAGIKVLELAHGAYVMPQTLKDMELGGCGRDLHRSRGRFPACAGTGQCTRSATRCRSPLSRQRAAPHARAARIVVLGLNGHPYTSLFAERAALDHYQQALSGLARRRPRALRSCCAPTPRRTFGPVRHVMDQAPDLKVSIDPRTPIDALMAATDLCVGSLSTATLQAATCGAAVVVAKRDRLRLALPTRRRYARAGGPQRLRARHAGRDLARRHPSGQGIPSWCTHSALTGQMQPGESSSWSRQAAHITSPPATGRFAPVM